MKTTEFMLAGLAWTIATLGSQAQAQWSARAPMPTPRDYAASCVCANRLYVFGGEYQAYGFLTDANEAYDPISDTWARHAPLPLTLAESGAVAVGGKILVVGGATFPNPASPQGVIPSDVPTVNVYDPGTDSWSTKSPMPTARSMPVMVLANGLVYAIGGYNNSSGETFGEVQVYDPAQDHWTLGPSMPTPRAEAAGAVVGNTIYILGGFNRIVAGLLSTAEGFDTTTMNWSTKAPMPTARAGARAAVLGGRIYVMGGESWTLGGPTAVVEIYDPQTDTWSTGEAMPETKVEFSMGAVSMNGVADDTIIFSGGYFPQPSSHTFAFSPPLNHPPVVLCKNVTVSADASCTANASIDNGSSDPDGDPITISQSPSGPYPLGTSTVTLTVTDSKGASSQCAATVTVVDTTPPNITCPANIQIGCSVDLLTPVSYSATASDNCDPSPTVTCSPASGSGFPVGTTTVNCTATDASANSSSCSFTVTRAPLGFVGFLAPIGGADATGGSFASPLRTFKRGSTIPIKFTASCGGSAVLSGIHRLQVAKYTDATTRDMPVDATPQDAATTGDEFRLTGGQWQFNLDTKATGMSVGTWLLIATLSDGSEHTVWIQLK